MHECLFWDTWKETRAVRCGKWKLLWSTTDSFPNELYDLETDIGESQNLLEAAKEEDLNKAEELKEAFRIWRGE